MDDIAVKTKRVDVLPIVKYYIEQLSLYEVFNKYVLTHDNCQIDVSKSLCVMVSNIICSRRPLYKVQEWLSEYSDGLGEEPLHAAPYNDDRLGRALDALFKADRGSLGAELSANAIRVHELETSRIHNDTTTVTFLGAYQTPDPQTVQLLLGHNKDGRPDCKQIVFGINTTEDGHVPLICSLFDGNTPDDKTHIPNWQRLRELIGKTDFLYIADSKLCSQENLNYIAKHEGKFITIMPKNRLEVKAFHELARAGKVHWEPAYQVESSRKRGEMVEYKTHEGLPTRDGYRLIWIHSSTKEKQDRARRKAMLHKAIKELDHLGEKLNSYNLRTKEQITAKIDAVCQPVRTLLKTDLAAETIVTRVQERPGRPGPNTVYKELTTQRYRLTWAVDGKAVEQASKLDGIFPLVTNATLPAPEVLRAYKKQPFLEKRIYATKSVLEVAPVFLKVPRRIEAMMFLYFVALMVITLIERNIAKNMKQSSISKLRILPQGASTKKPTWNNMTYFFRNVILTTVLQGDQLQHVSIQGMTESHAMIIKLLGLPATTYRTLTENWWRFGAMRPNPP